MGLKVNRSPIRRSKSFDDLKLGADFRQSDSKQASFFINMRALIKQLHEGPFK